jgi:hypothetical protein
MVTLGAFPDAAGRPVGSPYMQGATLMHELGHNFELTHAGAPQTPAEPNCKPNYMSVMNYLFQLRGLFNDAEPGVPHMDFSGEALSAIDENFPAEGFSFGAAARYQSGWYAPQGPGTIGTPARGYCTGGAFPNPPPAPMVRVDASSVAGPIDWNLHASAAFAQDLNFDGALASPLNAGSNDWASLRLESGRLAPERRRAVSRCRRESDPRSVVAGRGAAATSAAGISAGATSAGATSGVATSGAATSGAATSGAVTSAGAISAAATSVRPRTKSTRTSRRPQGIRRPIS